MIELEREIKVLAKKLINVFDSTEIKFFYDDHFSYMVSCFYYKQRLHLITMMEMGKTHDLQLICRCMIEGMAILFYAQNHPSYIEEWLAISDIENLRILEDKQKYGFVTPAEISEKIKSRAQKLSSQIRPKSAQDIKQSNRDILASDFKADKISMKELVRSLSQSEDHWHDIYSVYDRYSKWHHWNPSGIAQFADFTDNELSFIDCSLSIPTWTYGIFCLIQTSKMFDRQFSKKHNEVLLEIEDQMYSIFSNYVLTK